jgi:Mn-dependent DtxR family transcriptional regulator
MRVGTLAALGHSRGEIAHALDASPAEVRAAFERLKRVGHTLG